jgi:beta-glucosidase/6-phospho-beta-glucosidase/beta-galactosidase
MAAAMVAAGLFGFALFLGSSAIAGSATFPNMTIPNNVGVNTGVTSRGLNDQDFQMMRAAGIRFLRVDISWDTVENKKGEYDWSAYDSLLAKIVAYQIRPVFILAYGNSLYRDGDDVTMNSPPERAAFAEFAAAAVARYDMPGGIWEIWNEENTHVFWQASSPGNSQKNARERARNYMAMIDVSVPKMKAVRKDRDPVVISGGVLDIKWDVTLAWLDEAFSLGLLNKVDGLGVHL